MIKGNGRDLMELTGEITAIIYRNDTNGYTIANLVVDKAEITIVGYLPFVNKGDYVKVYGKIVTHLIMVNN